MKTLIEFIRKEIYHILRDYRTLTVLIGMPVLQIIIFGFAIRTDINEVNIGVVDLSKDYTTGEIINKIEASRYYYLRYYSENPSAIDNQFESGNIQQAIIFENNFSRNLYRTGKADIMLINDASNPNMANLVNSYTSAIISGYQMKLNNELKTKLPVKQEVLMQYNPELKSVFMFVPGLISFILMLISAMMTSIALTKEKEMGNMEILLVSPLNPTIIIIGKVIPYIFLGLINAISIVVISITVFDIPFRGSFTLFFAEILLFIITALSLGILISTVAKTQQVAMMVSLGALMMPTILLSGFIFPIENMPEFLQIVSYIIPARWFLIIAKGILLKGVGLEVIWKETLVLVGMLLFFILLSIKKFKIRLQ